MASKSFLKISAILCLFVYARSTNAQWTLLNSGTTETLNEIFFPVADTGFVVGENGFVLKTTDGGQNWNKLNTGLNLNFHELYFLNSSEGWIVGDSGSVCHTIDGGTSWNCTFLDLAANIDLHSVYALNSNIVFVGGNNSITDGYIHKSTNGGASWQTVFVESYIWAVDIIKIGMVSDSIGYSITRGAVLKTTDGGLNWRITDTTSVHAGAMFSVLEDLAYFPGNDTLYVCGWYPGYFGKSVNAGGIWQHTNSHDYFNLDFINPQTGYIMGWGNMQKTTDGGISFTDASGGNMELFYDVNSIDFIDEWTGYGCGKKGKIIKTINGGTTGVDVSSNAASNIVFYPNPTTGQLNFSRETNVLVTNLTGHIIADSKNTLTVDLTNQPAGIYMMTLTDKNGQVLQRSKVVKSKK